MKKLSALLMAAILLFSLAACSDNGKKSDTDPEQISQTEASTDSQQEITLPQKDEDEITLEPLVAVDNESCKITVTGATQSNLWGLGLEVEVENKTSDKALTFAVDNSSINGVSAYAIFAQDVQPGKKAKGTMTFDNEMLEDIGITKYTDIKVTFRVYDSENWYDDDLALETVHIYPYGEDKAEIYKRESKDSDIKFIDNDEVSVTVIGWGANDYFDLVVKFYIENKSQSTDYMFFTSGCAVNGVEVNTISSIAVPSDTVSFGEIAVMDSVLEEYKITEFTDISITMRAFETDSWDAEDVANETVHIYPLGQDKAQSFVRESADTDTVIVDNDKFTAIIIGLNEVKDYDRYDLCFYLVNKTEENIMFSMQDVSVNGYISDPFFSVNVAPGLQKFDCAEWYADDLEESDVKEIEEIEFTFTVQSPDDWTADDYFNQAVTYKP